MNGGSKGFLIVIAALAVVVLAFVGVTVSSYNGIVGALNTVEQKAADIDSQLQRRVDLIPNLVEVTKQFAQHETDVIESVTQARENMVNASTMQEKADADAEMTTALGGLVAVAESYPELTSSTVYIGLMDELAGTENRVAYSRSEYNAAVANYNKAITTFPGVIVAKIFGFEKSEYFEATTDAAAPVSIDLSLS